MSLTDRIYHDMFELILRGEFQPGEKFLTEQDAIERYKASRVTVRRAFAILEENRIISRKQKMGSVVNSSFSAFGGNLKTIAAVVPLYSHFVRNFLATLCDEASQRDVITILEPAATGEAQNEALIRLVLHGVRDIVIWGADRKLNMDLCLRLRILGVNLTFFDQIDPGNIADYVCLDNYAAVDELLNKAAGSGIKNIFYAFYKDDCIDTERERFEACREICKQRGWNFSANLPDCFPPESAIVAVNDENAVKVIHHNVPVFSIDGLEQCRQLGVTSYRQPMAELAKSCFASLLRQRKLGSNWRARRYRLRNGEPFV